VTGNHTSARRIWIVIERESGNEEREVKPGPEAAYGIVTGTCPGCELALGRKPVDEFRIRTEGCNRISHDVARYGGHCVTCNDAVGWVYAQFETIFGLEEDQRVLGNDFSRARAYG
jgi:hypothetical protein